MAEFTGLVSLWFCAQCNTVIAWPARIGEYRPPTTTCPTCNNSECSRPSKRWVRLIGEKIAHGLVPPYEV